MVRIKYRTNELPPFTPIPHAAVIIAASWSFEIVCGHTRLCSAAVSPFGGGRCASSRKQPTKTML